MKKNTSGLHELTSVLEQLTQANVVSLPEGWCDIWLALLPGYLSPTTIGKAVDRFVERGTPVAYGEFVACCEDIHEGIGAEEILPTADEEAAEILLHLIRSQLPDLVNEHLVDALLIAAARAAAALAGDVGLEWNEHYMCCSFLDRARAYGIASLSHPPLA